MELKKSQKRKILVFLPIITLFVALIAILTLIQSPNSTLPDADEINGTEYESVVIFRNDDPAPWTNTETLEEVNNVFIENQVPVTHGIVPHDDNSNESLHADHELCRYLEDEGDEDLFEYALHGYHHLEETDFHGGSEFGEMTYEEQKQKIEDGKQIIENCTNITPNTFIPPFNTYDETTVEVLAEEGFETVSGGFNFQKEYFDKTGVTEHEKNEYSIMHVPSNLDLENWEREELREMETIKQDYYDNKAENHLNVVLFHYFFFEEEHKIEKLDEIVKYFEEDGAHFITLREFTEGIQNDEITRTQNGWNIEK